MSYSGIAGFAKDKMGLGGDAASDRAAGAKGSKKHSKDEGNDKML